MPLGPKQQGSHWRPNSTSHSATFRLEGLPRSPYSLPISRNNTFETPRRGVPSSAARQKHICTLFIGAPKLHGIAARLHDRIFFGLENSAYSSADPVPAGYSSAVGRATPTGQAALNGNLLRRVRGRHDDAGRLSVHRILSGSNVRRESLTPWARTGTKVSTDGNLRVDTDTAKHSS